MSDAWAAVMIGDGGEKCQGAAFGHQPSAPTAKSKEQRAKSLLANRGVAQCVCARDVHIDLAGDQAVVVDAACKCEARAGVIDALEDSVLVDETEIAVAVKLVTYNNAGVVHPRQGRPVLGATI